jgi:pilin isopeptide linkage protein/LPXTG-motif cell wall-anchored protein
MKILNKKGKEKVKKKLSTYFSLLVLLSSVLIMPLIGIAEATSEMGETPASNTPLTAVDTTTSSQQENRQQADASAALEEHSIFNESETDQQQQTESTQSVEQRARALTVKPRAAVNDVITAMTITDKDGNPLDHEIGQWENFRVNGTFSLPNNQVSEGDTTTITLPSELKFGNTTAFDLKDTNGNIVAKAVIFPDTKQIVLTYTNYAETHSDISGSFFFYAGVDTTVINQQQTVVTSIDVDGKAFPIGFDFEGIVKEAHPISKSGWFIDGNDQQLQYYVAVNRSGKAYPNAKVTDFIKSNGVTYLADSFKIYKGEWQRNANDTDWVLANRVDVTANYSVNVAPDKRSFSIDFGQIGANDQFALYYKAEMSYKPVAGEVIENTASLLSDNVVIKEGSANTLYQAGGGAAEGYNYTIHIHKQDEIGNALAGAEFEVVRDRTGQTIETITTDTNGDGQFTNLLKDNYTIKETKAPNGYDLSGEEIKIAPADFDSNKEVFKDVVNKKSVSLPTNIQLEAVKELTGKILANGQFNFELLDDQGTVLQTKSNDAAGKISFDPINYTQEGTYDYTIREVAGTDSTITYDSTEYKVTVTVTDNGGQLEATANYAGQAIFKNTYQPAAGDIVLEASKQLDGKLLTAGQFNFELLDDQGTILQTKSNDASGNIYFDPINYTQVGTYNYTIREVAGTDSTITYDSTEYKVTVTVTDNGGQLEATANYAGQAIFKNTYKPTAGNIVLEASKQLDGKLLTAGQFNFELVDDQGTVLQTKSNDASGNIYFDPINYTQAGTYDYIIREAVGTDSTITYDATEYKVTVTVEDIAGQLTATAVYEKTPLFKNTYKPAPESAVLEASKQLEGKKLASGQFSFELVDEQGNVLQTKENDALGKIYFDPINYTAAGTYKYIIREVAGNDNTITYDTTEYQVTVTVTDQNGQLAVTASYASEARFKNTYSDPSLGKITLKKIDSQTSKVLANAEFELQTNQGTTLRTNIATGANGKITIGNLEPGDYQLVETKAPKGYKIDKTPVKFSIKKQNKSSKEKIVEKKNSKVNHGVLLKKIDSKTSQTLSGAKFVLKDAGGRIIEENLITDENGLIYVDHLTDGTYQFEEVEAPAGYRLDQAPVPFKVEAAKEQLVEVTKKNTPLAQGRSLPKTGEKLTRNSNFIGILLILSAVYVYRKRRVRNS